MSELTSPSLSRFSFRLWCILGCRYLQVGRWSFSSILRSKRDSGTSSLRDLNPHKFSTLELEVFVGWAANEVGLFLVEFDVEGVNKGVNIMPDLVLEFNQFLVANPGIWAEASVCALGGCGPGILKSLDVTVKGVFKDATDVLKNLFPLITDLSLGLVLDKLTASGTSFADGWELSLGGLHPSHGGGSGLISTVSSLGTEVGSLHVANHTSHNGIEVASLGIV